MKRGFALLVVAAVFLLVCSTPLAGVSPSPTAPTTTVASLPPSPTASAVPSPSVTTYENTKHGYSVALPEPYRHSDRLSLDGASGRPTAVDLFAARTPSDEISSETNSQTVSPSGNYVVIVYVFTPALVRPRSLPRFPRWQICRVPARYARA